MSFTPDESADQPQLGAATERPRYRPPLGMPDTGRKKRAGSLLLSIFLHALVIALLIVPFASPELMKEVLGAGGIGPAGGGGGGRKGTGGQMKQERLQFVRVAPTPVPTPTPPTVKPPEIKPPVIPPPVPPQPQPTPTPPAPTPAASAASEVKSETVGSGGGAGNDGGAGNGPGSGGGTGSGIGTGKGTGTGAGTGGGSGSIFPPSPTELFLPPLPVPGKAKGEIIVEFDVDSTGKVIDLQFTPTKDGAYNRKLREALVAIRFRPAVDARGVPVRAKAQLIYKLG